MKPTIAAIILTYNEEKMIANCLEAVQWCDEVIVVDSGSSDKTVDIAKGFDAKVITEVSSSFAQRRNVALSHVTSDWVFYIDADERVTPKLSKEILVHIETTPLHAIAMPRENMMYGKVFEHGGWSEVMIRAFRKSEFQGWQGDIHESPQFTGEPVHVHTPLLHFTHRNTIDGLQKTIRWTPIEAKLLYESGIPPVTLFTIFRKGKMEFFRRAILKQGRKDGMEGWIEAVVQAINRILVYIQVWELQQQPSLEEKYAQKEVEIAQLWKKEK